MNIVKLVFAETGTYDQMMLRPYEAIDSARNMSVLQQATRYGQNVSPEALSGSVGSILRPTANHLGQINIANGWNNKRFRFFMHVIEQDLTGTQSEQYISGYTDHVGGNFISGTIDPNMRMYVTGTIRMKSLTYMTDFGRQQQTTIGSAAHVFNQRFIPGMENVGTSTTNLQRPMDVFATLQTQDFRRFRAADDFLDPRTTFAHEHVKLSNRANALAPTYLSKMLKAGGAAFVNSDNDATSADMWGKAEGMVREDVYSQDEVLFELHRKTSFSDGDSFTFRELERLCPQLHSVTKLVPAIVVQQQQQSINGGTLPAIPVYTAGTFDGWNGQDIHTVWATILSNSLPPLMLDCMIHTAGFVVHNHTIGGEIDITWNTVQPFARNLDPTTARSLVEHFSYRLQNHVIRDLLAGNQMSFTIRAHFDVLGESRLEIALGNDIAVPYATPTFCDSLFTPVLTRGQQNVRKLANQIEFFTENLMQNDVGFGAQNNSPSPSILTSTGKQYHASAETL